MYTGVFDRLEPPKQKVNLSKKVYGNSKPAAYLHKTFNMEHPIDPALKPIKQLAVSRDLMNCSNRGWRVDCTSTQ